MRRRANKGEEVGRKVRPTDLGYPKGLWGTPVAPQENQKTAQPESSPGGPRRPPEGPGVPEPRPKPPITARRRQEPRSRRQGT